MKKRYIDIKRGVRVRTIVSGELDKSIFILLAMFVALNIVLYIYLVSGTIWNIVDRKDAETKTRSLSTKVGELELTYLGESKKIDIAFAESMGFKEARRPAFASRDALEASVLARYGQ